MKDIHKRKAVVDWLISFLLFLLVWLPRGLALDRFVTADEPKWLARSGNFYLALTQKDWANTFTREHPGVTVTWLGMFGYLWRYPNYIHDAPGRLTDSTQIEQVLRQHGKQPMDLLEAGRILIVLAISITLMAAFHATRMLVGRIAALMGFCLIAFDPFFVGLSRLLHLDGLLSSLCLLAIVLFLTAFAFSERKWLHLSLSGVVTGLAWLTKSPALILLPFTGLWMVANFMRLWGKERKFPMNDFRYSLAVFCAWGIIAVAIFVALFPAMWVHPLSVLTRIFAEAETYATEGHSTVVFFNGAVMMGDPGRRFYLINYLWRTTPIVIVGLILIVPGFFPKTKDWMTERERHLSAPLLSFAAIYIVLITLGAKKFDRYLLPIFPALDLVAGMGWVAAVRWLRDHRAPLWRYFESALLGIVAVGQVALTLSTFPYYLSYYNPWMGGARRAPQTMMIGWGEGLDVAARYLNQKPNASALQVVSWYPDGCFSYIFRGQTFGTPPEWEEMQEVLRDADYAVLYINQWQRSLPFIQMLRYFEEQTPETVVVLNGIEYAQIYNLKDIPPPK